MSWHKPHCALRRGVRSYAVLSCRFETKNTSFYVLAQATLRAVAWGICRQSTLGAKSKQGCGRFKNQITCMVQINTVCLIGISKSNLIAGNAHTGKRPKPRSPNLQQPNKDPTNF